MLTFSSCETASKDTASTELSPDEIVQLAQSNYNSGRTSVAEYYYKLLLQRYGMDTTNYIIGRFELAHLYIKKKNYEQAVPMLQEIVQIYETSVPGALPGEYVKLARMDLEKVPPEKLEEITARLKAETPSFPFDEEGEGAAEENSETDWWSDDESY